MVWRSVSFGPRPDDGGGFQESVPAMPRSVRPAASWVSTPRPSSEIVRPCDGAASVTPAADIGTEPGLGIAAVMAHPERQARRHRRPFPEHLVPER